MKSSTRTKHTTRTTVMTPAMRPMRPSIAPTGTTLRGTTLSSFGISAEYANRVFVSEHTSDVAVFSPSRPPV